MVTKDLILYRGDKKEFKFIAPWNLAGKEISFVVKADKDITGTRLIDKNSLHTGEICAVYTSASNKTSLTVTLCDSDSYRLNAGNYFYDIKNITDEETLFAGLFIIREGVQNVFDDTCLPDMKTVNYESLDLTEAEEGDICGISNSGKGEFISLSGFINQTLNMISIDEAEAGDLLITQSVNGTVKGAFISLSGLKQLLEAL